MRSLIAFAIVAVAVAVAVPSLYNRMEDAYYGRAPAPKGAMTDPPATVRAASAVTNSTMTIRPGAGGHFHVAADVDGRRMEFIIDTGATSIALRESDAARLGIHPARRDYTLRTATANGIMRVAPVELNRVDVGSLTVRNVQAVVFPDEALGVNLLGMSFLSRVRWEHRDGLLVLEQ